MTRLGKEPQIKQHRSTMYIVTRIAIIQYSIYTSQQGSAIEHSGASKKTCTRLCSKSGMDCQLFRIGAPQTFIIALTEEFRDEQLFKSTVAQHCDNIHALKCPLLRSITARETFSPQAPWPVDGPDMLF